MKWLILLIKFIVKIFSELFILIIDGNLFEFTEWNSISDAFRHFMGKGIPSELHNLQFLARSLSGWKLSHNIKSIIMLTQSHTNIYLIFYSSTLKILHETNSFPFEISYLLLPMVHCEILPLICVNPKKL